MRGYDRFLVVLGLTGLVVITLPSLLIYLAISLVGIPVAILLALAPGLALVLIAARALERTALDAWAPRFAGRANWLGSIAVVVGVLAAFAAFDTAAQRAAIGRLVAEDRQDLALPLPQGVIAVRSADIGGSCDDLCRRLLLTGAAKTVLLQRVVDPWAPLDFQSAAVAYWMEQGAACPDPNLREDNRLDIAGEVPTDRAAERPQPSIVLMRAEVSQGNCLKKHLTSLGKADVIITKVRLLQKPSGDKAGFQSGPKIITADRLSVHQKEASGFRETYRQTGVIAAKIWPVAVPVPTTGYAYSIGIGLGRSDIRENISSPYYEEPDWPDFLTKTLGLALEMPVASEGGP